MKWNISWRVISGIRHLKIILKNRDVTKNYYKKCKNSRKKSKIFGSLSNPQVTYWATLPRTKLQQKSFKLACSNIIVWPSWISRSIQGRKKSWSEKKRHYSRKLPNRIKNDRTCRRFFVWEKIFFLLDKKDCFLDKDFDVGIWLNLRLLKTFHGAQFSKMRFS